MNPEDKVIDDIDRLVDWQLSQGEGPHYFPQQPYILAYVHPNELVSTWHPNELVFAWEGQRVSYTITVGENTSVDADTDGYI